MRPSMQHFFASASVIFSLAICDYAGATDLQVPADYATIQAAINAASDGATIRVSNGIYNETIDFLQKEIKVIGESRDGTIIDCAGLGGDAVKMFDWTDRPGVVWPEIPGVVQLLANLTIRNGERGIYIEGSSANLDNLLVSNCGTNSSFYGGIYSSWTPSATISNCLVENCLSRGNYGSGIQTSYDRSEVINCHLQNCSIESNVSAALFESCDVQGIAEFAVQVYASSLIYRNYERSGAYVPSGNDEDLWATRFLNCTVTGFSSLNGAPVRLRGEGSNAVFTHCEISNNIGRNCGAFEVSSSNNTLLRVLNCTITQNSIADNSRWRWGSVLNNMNPAGTSPYYSNKIIFRNSILWDNDGWKEIEGPGENYDLENNWEGFPIEVEYSLVQGGYAWTLGEEPQFSFIDGAGVAILDTAPLFADPANSDYRLQSSSPAIDAGDPNSPLDADGSIADLGAYPYLTFAPEYPTDGFMEPLSSDPVTVKGNRVLPLKVQIFDESGIPITEFGTAPKVKVTYSATNAEPIDVTSDALPEGVGDEAGFFEVTGDFWHFNLETKPFQSPGEYTIEIITGDASDYKLATTTATFIRE